jgi:hypothetical protein
MLFGIVDEVEVMRKNHGQRHRQILTPAWLSRDSWAPLVIPDYAFVEDHPTTATQLLNLTFEDLNATTSKNLYDISKYFEYSLYSESFSGYSKNFEKSRKFWRGRRRRLRGFGRLPTPVPAPDTPRCSLRASANF